MEKHSLFSDIGIVSCGTMSLELNYLKDEGFLDTNYLHFITPGLHQDIHALEKQLTNQIQKAKEKVKKILVVYGGKYCYVNADNPTRTIQNIIEEQGTGVVRINATHCMDMLASEEEREIIRKEMVGDEKVWWMTPGWIKYRNLVFKGWDKGIANENFPRHTGGAIVIDPIDYLEQYMGEKPEEFLEYCDWMGIPMQSYKISFDRFKFLLEEKAKELSN